MEHIVIIAKESQTCFASVESCYHGLSAAAKKCVVGKDGNDSAIETQAIEFHSRADSYTKLLHRLQILTISKVEMKSSSGGIYSSYITLVLLFHLFLLLMHCPFSEPMKFESDPDASNSSRAKPLWYRPLLSEVGSLSDRHCYISYSTHPRFPSYTILQAICPD
jgi:hypothetical protein